MRASRCADAGAGRYHSVIPRRRCPRRLQAYPRRLHQHRPIRADGRILAGKQAIGTGCVLGFHRQTGRDGCRNHGDRREYLFWTHGETGGWRWKRLALPESRDEDRQLSDYPSAGAGRDFGGQSSFRHARPLRPGSLVKAGRDRSYPSGSISARGNAGSPFGDHGSGGSDACQE